MKYFNFIKIDKQKKIKKCPPTKQTFFALWHICPGSIVAHWVYSKVQLVIVVTCNLKCENGHFSHIGINGNLPNIVTILKKRTWICMPCSMVLDRLAFWTIKPCCMNGNSQGAGIQVNCYYGKLWQMANITNPGSVAQRGSTCHLPGILQMIAHAWSCLLDSWKLAKFLPMLADIKLTKLTQKKQSLYISGLSAYSDRVHSAHSHCREAPEVDREFLKLAIFYRHIWDHTKSLKVPRAFAVWLHSTPGAIGQADSLLLPNQSIAIVAMVRHARFEEERSTEHATMHRICWFLAFERCSLLSN